MVRSTFVKDYATLFLCGKQNPTTVAHPARRRPFLCMWVPAVAVLAYFIQYADDKGNIQDRTCEDLVAAGDCLRNPLHMNRLCPFQCEEGKPQSELRERAVIEDVAGPSDCEAILRLAVAAAIPGDGYGGDSHPFSNHERFSGLTPVTAARWAAAQPQVVRDSWADSAVRVFIQAARRIRNVTQRRFEQLGVQKPFVDDFVHLACREAEDVYVEDGDDEQELPARFIFADNCFKDGDFSCKRGPPFYHWRTYSASMFLHDGLGRGVKGGNFHFSNDWSGSATALVEPRCGRTVAYNAGPANLHGIDLQKVGRSCMLSVFMTDDQNKAVHKYELDTSEEVLESAGEEWQDDTANSATQKYYESCAKVSYNGNDTSENVKWTRLDLEGHEMYATTKLDKPQITLVDNFLSLAEREYLIRRAQPNFKVSTVFEDGTLTTARYRSSQTAWLKDGEILKRIERRISLLTGLDLRSAEEMQIAYYAAGDLGRYEPHMDWGSSSGEIQSDFSVDKGEESGSRVATFLMYLRDVPAGGHTFFTELDITITPKAGMAVFWYNMKSNREGDMLTRHGACPVLQGEKYIATKWIHEAGNRYLFTQGFGRLGRNWEAVAAEMDGFQKFHSTTGNILPADCVERQAVGMCESEGRDICHGICSG